MIIKNSNSNDIDEIFRLYQIATDFQKKKNSVVWPVFERSLIEKEIEEKKQWKIIINKSIACVWATTFNDPQIWEEKNNEQAVYIHRIATNSNFKGQHFVNHIIQWSKTYAFNNHKRFIRMDTVGNNEGLINYYTKCGFNFLGLHTLKNTDNLPTHYKSAIVSLFQIEL